MVHVYQPRPVVPAMQLHLEQDYDDAVLGIVDADGAREWVVAEISEDGMVRDCEIDAGAAAIVGIPLDDDGCIALAPDDPAMRKIAELEARVKQLETPTVAPELTDEQCNELWRVFYATDAGSSDDHNATRAMLAAYEAMRRPITDEDVERAAEAAAHASTFTWTSWDGANEGVKNDYRRITRAALEAVL